MNTILILGTGNAQVDLIEYCKQRGFTVCTCSNANGDPGQALSDNFELIDISDVPKVIELATRCKADLVYSVGSDVAMPTACAVSEALSLPHFVSSKTALLCNVKSEFRAFLGMDFEGNLPFQVMADANTPILLDYPLIMKPVDSQGQRGVRTVTSHESFLSTFAESMAFSRSGRVILEELIDGPEVSVNTYSVDGRIVFFVLSDRLIWADYPGGLIREHVVPSIVATPKACELIYDLVARVLQKLKILNGPAYFQIKLRGDEPRLIEVTPRLDGCHMWRLLKYYTGIDLLDLTVRHLTGSPPQLESVQATPGTGGLSLGFFCEPPGTLFDPAKHELNDSLWLRWYYQKGDKVKRVNGLLEKCGYHISRLQIP